MTTKINVCVFRDSKPPSFRQLRRWRNREIKNKTPYNKRVLRCQESIGRSEAYERRRRHYKDTGLMRTTAWSASAARAESMPSPSIREARQGVPGQAPTLPKKQPTTINKLKIVSRAHERKGCERRRYQRLAKCGIKTTLHSGTVFQAQCEV